MLKVTNLETGYGNKQIINGVSLEVNQGEIVALVGHNGAGKSTILKAIFGLLPVWKGTVEYNGKVVHNRRPAVNVKEGLSFLLQGNRVFTELTVQENLEIGGYLIKGRERLKVRMEEIFDLFPRLRERRQQNAGTLSGGEQQMLALANTLMLQPKLLLMDEPSLGLAPQSLRAMFEMIQRINQPLGTTLLIVEQKVRQVLEIADRAYILKLGQVSDNGQAKELLKGDRLQKAFL
jgi:branched-chain amino acid transport system ATP-binding protein